MQNATSPVGVDEMEDPMIHKILVGVDGTEGSRRALEWTASRASELGAEVVAVLAVPPASRLMLSIPPLPIDPMWSLREVFEHQWCRPLRDAGVGYRSVIVEDDPARGLVAVADREDTDLLVVGAHGHGSLADRLLGSTSYTVSHRAHCPVVVIPSN
jgi:nucleotide-binding universal stress UspA family protein